MRGVCNTLSGVVFNGFFVLTGRRRRGRIARFGWLSHHTQRQIYRLYPVHGHGRNRVSILNNNLTPPSPPPPPLLFSVIVDTIRCNIQFHSERVSLRAQIQFKIIIKSNCVGIKRYNRPKHFYIFNTIIIGWINHRFYNNIILYERIVDLSV